MRGCYCLPELKKQKQMFNPQKIPLNFKLSTKLVNSRDKTQREKRRNVVDPIQCNQENSDVYIDSLNNPTTKQWHRRATIWGQDLTSPATEGQQTLLSRPQSAHSGQMVWKNSHGSHVRMEKHLPTEEGHWDVSCLPKIYNPALTSLPGRL